mgnify:CR=1 FL=1
MICLDTSFILDLLKKRQVSIDKLKLISGEEKVSTEINYFETLYGVFKRSQFNQNELDIVQNLFSNLRVFPLDSMSSYKAAEIGGELSRKGMTIETNDILIAGICLANNCKILTRDTKHFSRIKGLKVETY